MTGSGKRRSRADSEARKNPGTLTGLADVNTNAKLVFDTINEANRSTEESMGADEAKPENFAIQVAAR